MIKWDLFGAHRTQIVLSYCKNNNIKIVFVPPGMTDVMQEMDVGVNMPFKNKLRQEYICWRSKKSTKLLFENYDNKSNFAETINISVTLSAIKTIHVHWLVTAWKYILYNKI